MIKHLKPELLPALRDDYGKKGLVKDISAGIMVGIVALPLAIALAIASGLGPKEGIVTSVVAGLVSALVGGSRHQISGVTGAFSVVVSGLLAKFGMAGLASATFIAGVILVIMALFKAGALVKYIPAPVVAGFTMGIAAIIFISQLKDFLGIYIHFPAGNLKKIIAIFSNLNLTQLSSVLTGAAALAVIITAEKLNPRLPSMFLALIVCSVINIWAKAPTLGDFFGSENLTLTPDLSFLGSSGTIAQLLPAAATIAMLSAISALLSAVVAEELSGKKHNPHSELFGQGLANIIAPIFGGSPSTGAVARTSENVRAGAKSPISAVVHCLVMALWGFVFMGLAAYIPMSAFAAVLFIVCYNMSDFKRAGYICRVSLKDITLLTAAFLLTVFADLILAILLTSAAAAAVELLFRLSPKHRGSIICEDGTVHLKGRISYLDLKALSDIETDVLDFNGITRIDSDALLRISRLLKSGKIKRIRCDNAKLMRRVKHDTEFVRRLL